jgi:hypothetical protein
MSIARLTTTFAFSLLAAQLASGVAAAACPNPGKTVELKFKVKADECVEQVNKKDGTNGTTINVCVGDTVQWKVSGKAKLIAFRDRTPFAWAASGFEGNKIEGVVKPDTARTCTAAEPCKYTVYVKDMACVLDPAIIVEN